MTIARSVRCGSCGGQAPLVALTPTFPCPFCKATLVVPPELLRELGAYGEAVATAHAEARDQASLAAQYQIWTGPASDRIKLTAITIGLAVGLPVLVGIAGSFLMSQRILPQVIGPVVSVLTTVSAFVGVAVCIWLQVSWRRKHVGPEAGARGLACPQCGAPNALAAGAPVGACRYCRAPLIPTRTIMRDAVADAQATARRARVERRRAERAMMTNVQSWSASNIVPYIAVGPFVVMLGFAALGTTFDRIVGPRPFEPGLLILWAMFAGGVGVLFLIWYFRKDRAERWERVTSAVAKTHSGLRMDSLGAAVHWLDTHWEGEFAADHLVVGPAFSAIAAWVTGLPALCWIDPVRASEHQEARIVVLLAAWIPGLSDGAGQPRPRTPGLLGTEQALLGIGFFLEIVDAGLVARATSKLVDRWRKRPEEALALAPVLSLMGAAASAVDARPVLPPS